MNIVNNGNWCQITHETGAPSIRTVTSILRRDGYTVTVSAMGMQITQLGRMRLTLIDVRPGRNADTSPVTAIACAHIPMCPCR